MIATCPRCGSVDLHTSRIRGSGEAFFRLLGLRPRRCSACGWRGIKLYPAHVYRRPESTAASYCSSNGAALVVNRSVSDLVATAPALPELQRHGHDRHRHHRRHRHSPAATERANMRLWRALLLAIAVGCTAGVFAHSCASSMPHVSE